METRGQKIWYYVKCILWLIGLFFLSQVPTLLATIVGKFANKASIPVQVGIGVVWLIIFTAIIIFFIKFFNKYSKEGFKKINIGDGIVVFLYYLVGLGITGIGTVLMQVVYGDTTTENQAVIETLFGADQSMVTVLCMTISIAIGAPILEELLFRGIPVAFFGDKMPMWVIGIVTSLLFSAGHLSTNIISFIIYFAMGMLMFLTYRTRKNIGDSMLFHFFQNGLAAFMMLKMYLDAIN